MTQYFVPSIRHSIVARSRLLPSLADTVPALTVVHGAAGSGKSTYITQYAQQLGASESAVVWISLNSDDSGRDHLWSRIVTTMQRTAVWGDDFPFASFSPTELADEKLTAALRRGFESLPGVTTIVLDDYHHVNDASADDILVQLARDVSQLHFVIGTRVAGTLTSPEIAASIPVALVEAESIVFSADDTAVLLELNGLGRNIRLAKEIRTATHGWPLATHALVIEALRGEISVDKPIAAMQPSRFLRSLVRTRLARATPELRNFVLRVSLADEITVALAADLSAVDAGLAQAFLDQIEVEGMGTWQYRDGDEIFRFHPLLRESLEKAAEAQLPSTEIRRLRTMLADSVGIARPGRALELALELQDWERMDAVIRKQFPTISSTRAESTLKILERVPLTVARQYSSILGARTILEYARPATSSLRLKRAFSLILDGTPTKSPHDRLADGGMRMAAARLTGHGAKALDLADKTLDRIDLATETELEHHDLILATLLNQSAITLIYDCQFDRALPVLARAHDHAVRVGLRREPLHALALTALTHALRGDMVSARAEIARCEEHDAPAGWRDGYLGAGYRLARALCFLDEMKPDLALAELAVLAPHEPTIEHWPYLAIVEAWSVMQRDGADAAHSALKSVLSRKRWRLPPVDGLRTILTTVEADILVAAGQPQRALKLSLPDSRSNTLGANLARGRLALSRGEADSAFAMATEAIWKAAGSPRLHSEALLLRAVAAQHIGRSDLAVDALMSALSVLDTNELRLPLLTVPLVTLRAIVAADASGALDAAALDTLPDVFRRVPVMATLSPAELRVIRALAETPGTSAISASLHLSVNTVRSHLKSIYRKLGVNTRRDAITLAADLGLLGDTAEGSAQ
ncbi:MAG: LuxR C-terminal-related transcriptional regulator [Rhodoglobus sp.]